MFVLTAVPGGDIVSGVTYAGVSMNRIATQAPQGNVQTYMYQLANPASGANNIVISTSASTAVTRGCSASYTGVDQTTPINAFNSQTNSGTTSISDTVTSSVDNCWAVMGVFADGQAAGTATTQRVVAAQEGIYDSNGVISPAGMRTLTITCLNDSDSDTIFALAPSGGGGGGSPRDARYLSLLGVG